MRHDRLLLAGENAHTVPPTGAKSLNLALADVRVLHEAIVGYLDDGRDEVLDRYTERAGAGVDGAALFVLDDDDVAHPGERLASDRQRQRAELAMIPQMAGTADVVAGAITIADLNDLRWSPTYPRQKSHHRVSHRVKLVRSDLRTHIR